MPVLSDDISIGPEARVTVNGLPFAVVEGSYRDFAEEVVVTDTESNGVVGSYQQRRHGLQDFELNTTMQFDVTIGLVPDVALFPRPKSFAAVTFRPNKDNGLHLYECPIFKVFDCSGQFAVRGSQPVTTRFAGKSDGAFIRHQNGVLL